MWTQAHTTKGSGGREGPGDDRGTHLREWFPGDPELDVRSQRGRREDPGPMGNGTVHSVPSPTVGHGRDKCLFPTDSRLRG